MGINFWENLKKPLFVLAPMEDVTDVAFRTLIAQYGKPDVMFSEFTSADGLLFADEKGKKKLMRKLAFSDIERPIVAQLFTSIPEHMEKAASLVQEMGFDGLDINMGCPDRAVEKQGCGAALIKDPEKAREIIRAGKRGAPSIPLSVKTRAGYSRDEELDAWVRVLLGENIAALTIHARTRKDMSKVPARWELVTRTVAIRDEMEVGTLILGNGDVVDVADARKKVEDTGCDGVMFGRAIYGNPWLFSQSRDYEIVLPKEKIQALIEHLELFEKLLADVTNYAVMKKHFKAYIHGWDGAKELRIRLMETTSTKEVKRLLREELARS